MIDIICKAEATIEAIGQSDTVKRLIELKLLMDSDNEILTMIKNFKNAEDLYNIDPTLSKDLIEEKEKLYSHPVVSEYRKLYSDVNFSFAKFNRDLTSLVNTKAHTCNKA